MRWLIVAWVALAAIANAEAAPALDSPRAVDQDQRLRYMADEYDLQLRRSDVLIDDPQLVEYLEGVLHRLFPDAPDELRIGVHRSVYSNAFALPNGSIYLNAGLLARLDSESQLALIIAHEGEHYLRRHGVQSILSAKSTSAVGMTIGIGIGVPIAGALLAGSSYAGFSRSLERDADELGLDRVVAAGYAADDAHVWFDRMAREAKALKRRDGSLFASHPKLADRARTMRRLADTTDVAGGDYGRERFLTATERIRMAALADMVEQRQARATVLLLEEHEMLEHFPPAARFFLGEAYRLRNDKGDTERAGEQYRLAARLAPDFPPTWRGLGMHEMRHGDSIEALAAFERYLKLEPDASDAGFIEQYVEMLKVASSVEGGMR